MADRKDGPAREFTSPFNSLLTLPSLPLLPLSLSLSTSLPLFPPPPSLPPFSHRYDVSGHAYASGLIGLPELRYWEEKNAECQSQLSEGNFHYRPCFDLMDKIVAAAKNSDGKKVSTYDNRLWEAKLGLAGENFPKGHKRVEQFLGNADRTKRRAVLSQLNAVKADDNNLVFKECTDPPYYALAGQDGMGVTEDIAEVLDRGTVEMLFFNGMNDIICNHVSNEAAIEALPWSRIGEFKSGKRQIWNGGEAGTGERGPAGFLKSMSPLHYLKISESGHMVPMDRPQVALEMIRELLTGTIGGSKVTKDQNLGTSDFSTCKAAAGGDGGGTGGGESGGGGGGGAAGDQDLLPCGPTSGNSTAVIWTGFAVLAACAAYAFYMRKSAKGGAGGGGGGGGGNGGNGGNGGKYVRVVTGEVGDGDVEIT